MASKVRALATLPVFVSLIGALIENSLLLGFRMNPNQPPHLPLPSPIPPIPPAPPANPLVLLDSNQTHSPTLQPSVTNTLHRSDTTSANCPLPPHPLCASTSQPPSYPPSALSDQLDILTSLIHRVEILSRGVGFLISQQNHPLDEDLPTAPLHPDGGLPLVPLIHLFMVHLVLPPQTLTCIVEHLGHLSLNINLLKAVNSLTQPHQLLYRAASMMTAYMNKSVKQSLTWDLPQEPNADLMTG